MYRLSDPTRAALLDQMRSGDPTTCGDEIALLRVLIQEAAESNKPALVERLVSSMARCQAAHVNAQLKAGNLIERSANENLLGAGQLAVRNARGAWRR